MRRLLVAVFAAWLEGTLLKTAVGMQKKQHVGQKTLSGAPGSDADPRRPAPCLRSVNVSCADIFLPHIFTAHLCSQRCQKCVAEMQSA